MDEVRYEDVTDEEERKIIMHLLYEDLKHIMHDEGSEGLFMDHGDLIQWYAPPNYDIVINIRDGMQFGIPVKAIR